MTAKLERKIVVEFEKIQTIRKHANTILTICKHCGCKVDAVTLTEAAALFEIDREGLFQFIRQNNCHYDVDIDDRVYLCVPSLLESMQHKNHIRRLRAEGE